MLNEDTASNILLTLLCYAYIIFIIFLSSKMTMFLHVSQKASRKFLHAMIGNLPFVMPFFTASIYPVLVAAPFIIVTFIASPISPFKNVSRKLKGLADITEEGHHLGLVFYAISYTVLAFFFASKPHVVAAGILPMAYGDSAASLVGERYGRMKYRLFANRSLEGSAAMFIASLVSVITSLAFFSTLYSFLPLGHIIPGFAVASAATLVEALSPKGTDNLAVPTLGALTFLMLTGGV